MEQSTIARWTEVQFIQICMDLIAIRNDMLDLMDIIDGLAQLGGYDAERCKLCAQQMLAQYHIKPNKEELIILCKLNDVNTREIKRVANTNNRFLYESIERYQQNGMYFYPRMTQEEHEIIKKFINTFYTLRKVGIYNDIKYE